MHLRLLLAFLLSTTIAFSQQNDFNKSVQVQATVDAAGPSITLDWVLNAVATAFTVYRRLPGSTSWGSPIVNLGGDVFTYTDTNVEPGVVYEYRVAGTISGDSPNGYIYAGMEIPPAGFRGRLLLVVDATHATALAPEIELMISDFRADGWQVDQITADPSDAVADV